MQAESVLQQQVQTLYSSHHGWLIMWLRKKLGDSFEAADLAHDTFVRLMAGRAGTQLGEQPRALLTHIAKGLVVDHWRRRAVEQAYYQAVAALPEPEAPSPETRLLILEALHRVVAMLDTLPDKTQRIFLLAQLDGLTYQAIADQLDTTLITVKRHMRKAFIACMAVADQS
jgi:RNA polymerase sigma-70 factor (ECF subfamily)